jgi:citrate lyase subunit beta/citryl-CoA lyase
MTHRSQQSEGDPELHVLMEDAKAFLYLREILEVRQVRSLVFGIGDFSATLGLSTDALGFGAAGKEQGGPFKSVRSVIAVAAKGMGATAIDSPFPDFQDTSAFREEAHWAKAAGFDGKWCIHPSQIAVANDVFAPTPNEFQVAREICEAHDAFVVSGDSASLLWSGKMIDEATARIARLTYDRGRLIGL